jgi:hypothetical protein
LTTLTIATIVLALQGPSIDLDRWIYPVSKPIKCPPIELVTKEAPDLQPWAERARNLAREWYPQLTSLLSTEKFKSPRRLKFVFRVDQDAPAYATGNEISFKVGWVRAHPEDFGMVVHELTHIVQQYPDIKADTGWLVEGIADYTRWWRYEPEAPRSPINFAKASYRDAYRTTAYFLAWSSQKYNSRLVPALDRSLREAKDPMPVFVEITGKSADELWAEFKAKFATTSGIR